MKILVVEDETKLAEYLRAGLARAGHSVDVAADGLDGLHAALEGEHDLVVLDINLPRLDGLGLLAALRRSRATPVIVLSARSAVDDRVAGLLGGADDYLAKPFSFTELLARIQVQQRRQPGAPAETVLRLADLELDLLARRARRAGERLDLTPKEFRLLETLLRRQGQVLSRTELAAQVWDMNFDSDTNVVEVAVRRLRGKLDAPFAAPLLHTVRGMGYVLEARAAEPPPADGGAAPATAPDLP